MNNKYKLGSLFDGSGGFPLAGSMCGIEPVWASEVEPYPIAVTRSRFPAMKHLGDITKINGAEIEPVDIITFGSPCQDLSVAGKRAGLKHEVNGDEETTRSGLFLEAVRIIKEMRDATNGVYPRFALWENVPGAFSSNGGEDFRIVLEELIKIVEPAAVMPPVPTKGWPYADSYSGDGWSLAYRVFDAQYWGVPQRRRRIHLVIDFRGERAREVLFERKGVRGYFETGRSPWQGAEANAKNCIRADDRAGENGCVAFHLLQDPIPNSKVSPCMGQGNSDRGQASIGVVYKIAVEVNENILDDQGGQQITVRTDGKCPTLRAEMHGNIHAVMQPIAFSFDSLASNSMKSRNPHSGCREVEVSKTLDTTYPDPSKNQGGIAIVETIFCIDGDKIGKAERAGGSGLGIRPGDKMYTLTAKDAGTHAVAFQTYQKVTGPLMANSHPGSYTGQDAFSDMLVAGVDCRNMNESPELYPTLQAKPNGGQSLNFSHAVRIQYIVRRLTPTECARLQGFADRWGDIDPKEDFTDDEYRFWCEVYLTKALIDGTVVENEDGELYFKARMKPYKHKTKPQMLKWYNKLRTDSSEYKMWGNGIALPPALYCMQGIVDALEGKGITYG